MLQHDTHCISIFCFIVLTLSLCLSNSGCTHKRNATMWHQSPKIYIKSTFKRRALHAFECTVSKSCKHPQYRCYPSGKRAGCGRYQSALLPCQKDGDCKGRGSHFICTSSACSARSCRPGCQTDKECGPSKYCQTTTYRCKIRKCVNDLHCPKMHICRRERCVPTPCSSAQDCEGYCVKNRCYSIPGRCVAYPG